MYINVLYINIIYISYIYILNIYIGMHICILLHPCSSSGMSTLVLQDLHLISAALMSSERAKQLLLQLFETFVWRLMKGLARN